MDSEASSEFLTIKVQQHHKCNILVPTDVQFPGQTTPGNNMLEQRLNEARY
jgi:hypothetical protein